MATATVFLGSCSLWMSDSTARGPGAACGHRRLPGSDPTCGPTSRGAPSGQQFSSLQAVPWCEMLCYPHGLSASCKSVPVQTGSPGCHQPGWAEPCAVPIIVHILVPGNPGCWGPAARPARLQHVARTPSSPCFFHVPSVIPVVLPDSRGGAAPFPHEPQSLRSISLEAAERPPRAD